jgi:hypothetical protein
MATELVKASSGSVTVARGDSSLPVLVERAGGAARFAWEEFLHKQFHVRTLMFLTLVLAIGLAVVAPYVQRAQRIASACYIVGDVVTPGRMETLGRQLTVRGAIKSAGGLRLSEEDVNIRLVRPASGGVLEQVLSIDMNDPSTDYTIKPGDRLIVAKSKSSWPRTSIRDR